MLEWQWFGSGDPEAMLRFLGSRPDEGDDDGARGVGRKLRLFTFGCCRRVKHLTDRRVQKSLAVFERSLDGAASDEELRRAEKAAREACRAADEAPGGVYPATFALALAGSAGPLHEVVTGAVSAAKEAETAAAMAAEGKHYRPCDPATSAYRLAGSAERAYQIALVHDIFGNPYHPETLDPSWRTQDVAALARDIYREEAFAQMPTLADLLEDAGCDGAAILAHCRGPGPHARGCWVVELVVHKG